MLPLDIGPPRKCCGGVTTYDITSKGAAIVFQPHTFTMVQATHRSRPVWQPKITDAGTKNMLLVVEEYLKRKFVYLKPFFDGDVLQCSYSSKITIPITSRLGLLHVALDKYGRQELVLIISDKKEDFFQNYLLVKGINIIPELQQEIFCKLLFL